MFGGYYYTRDTVSPQVSPMYMPYAQKAPQMPYLANLNSACAMIVAGPDYPSITGLVTFADVPGGVRVCADIAGLPPHKPASGEKQPVGPFGFHIHEKGHCVVGNPAKPFEACGEHWNPTRQPHGNHVNRGVRNTDKKQVRIPPANDKIYLLKLYVSIIRNTIYI